MGGTNFRKPITVFNWYVEPDTVFLTEKITCRSSRNEKSSSWLNAVAENFFVKTLNETGPFSVFSLIPYLGWTWVDDQIVPILRISYPIEDGSMKVEDVTLQQKLLDPLYKATLKSHETSFKEVFRPDRPIPSWNEFKDNEDLTRPIGRSEPEMEDFRIPLVPTRFVVYSFGLNEQSKVTPAAGEMVPAGQFGRRCKTSTSIPPAVLEELDFTPVLGFSIEFTDEELHRMKTDAFGQKFSQGKSKKKPIGNQTEGNAKMATKRKADETPATAPPPKVVKPTPPVQMRAPQAPTKVAPAASPPAQVNKSPVLSSSAKSPAMYKKQYIRTKVCDEVRKKRDENMAKFPKYQEVAVAANDFLQCVDEEFEYEGKTLTDQDRTVLNYIIIALLHNFCCPARQSPLDRLGEHGPIQSPVGNEFTETEWIDKFEDIVSSALASPETRARMFDVLNSYSKHGTGTLRDINTIDGIKLYVKNKIEGTNIPLMFAQTLVLEFISCAMFDDEGGQKTEEEKPEEIDFM
jgi:hypothetical protein